MKVFTNIDPTLPASIRLSRYSYNLTSHLHSGYEVFKGAYYPDIAQWEKDLAELNEEYLTCLHEIYTANKYPVSEDRDSA